MYCIYDDDLSGDAHTGGGVTGEEAPGLHSEGHQDHRGQTGAHRWLRHPHPHVLLLPRHL